MGATLQYGSYRPRVPVPGAEAEDGEGGSHVGEPRRRGGDASPAGPSPRRRPRRARPRTRPPRRRGLGDGRGRCSRARCSRAWMYQKSPPRRCRTRRAEDSPPSGPSVDPRQADRCNRPLAEVLEAPYEQLPVRSVAGRGHRPAGRPRCALACPRLRPGRADLRVPHRPRDLASLLPRPGRARARAARSRRRGRPGDERPGDGPRRREGAPRSRPLRGDAPSRGARRPGAGGTPSPAASGTGWRCRSATARWTA